MNIALAEGLAKKVLSAYANSLPVDVKSIAEQLGVEVRIQPLCFHPDPELRTASGAACIENGRRVIFVNSSDSPARQRFTLAHELAHHVIGHTENGRRFRDTMKSSDYAFQADPNEIEANRFAAELLMPADSVISAFSSNEVSSLSELASLFGVSEAAMRVRAKNLRLLP